MTLSRKLAIPISVLGVVAVAGAGALAWRHHADAPSNQQEWAVVKKYCFECHNYTEQAGGRSFENLSPEHVAANAETWEAAIRKLSSGLMPPAGEPRPDGQTVAGLVNWLETEIDAAADKTPPAPGRVALHRLNRREYAHAIHDLLALDVDASEWLPQDNVNGRFDNDAEALQVSPSFVTQYIDAARAIAQEAVGDAKAPPIATTYGDPAAMVISLPPQGAPGTGHQQEYIPGMPFGTRGGMVVEHDFPADGEYELGSIAALSVFARAYEHTLTGTLRYRPVVLTLWAIVAVLMIPFYMFSQRELAPAEDQGVVFGVIQASPNSTIDQTRLFTNQVYDVYHAFPESQSIFQITSPTGGFGGMVTKPWSERKKTTQQLLLESTGPLSKIAGVRVIPLTPPPLPGGGDFPGGLRDRVAGRTAATGCHRQAVGGGGICQRQVHLRRL